MTTTTNHMLNLDLNAEVIAANTPESTWRNLHDLSLLERNVARILADRYYVANSDASLVDLFSRGTLMVNSSEQGGWVVTELVNAAWRNVGDDATLADIWGDLDEMNRWNVAYRAANPQA